MAAAERSRKVSGIWLFWLLGFSLCFSALFLPKTDEEGEQSKPQAQELSKPAPLASGNFQFNSSLPEIAPQPFCLQGSQGLLTGPDVNASVPSLNNRGQVVVEEQEKADLLAAFTVPAAPSSGAVADVKIIPPLKIAPDPEAVKQKIADKRQQIFDDAVFKAELAKLEAEMKTRNFPEHAGKIPDNGLGSVIKKHSRIHGVDARLVWAVMRNESGFNPQAVSPKGAMGLMQLIPSTAALMGVSDPFDVEENISGGVRFLKLCLNKFNHNVVWALAAYNAGPDNVSKYQGCPPFAETRNYVLKVMRDYTGKTIILPTIVTAAKGALNEKNQGAAKPANQAATAPESGLDWKIPQAKFKVAGPTWKKLPLGPTIIAGKIPDAIRQNPEVARLLAKQNARKLLP